MPETPDHLPTPAPVLALIRDLMFSSRVTSTAASLGVAVKLLRDPALLSGEPGRRLLVDLNLPGAIEAAAAWKRAGGEANAAEGEGRRRVVTGFVSHVDAETIGRARAAGIDRVMARSQFVQVIPDLLR